MTDTDRVWIGRTSTRRAYHTDPTCSHLPTEHKRQIPQQTAVEQLDLRECRFCANDATNQGRNQYDVFPKLHGAAED
jgi:hypothetical protein